MNVIALFTLALYELPFQRISKVWLFVLFLLAGDGGSVMKFELLHSLNGSKLHLVDRLAVVKAWCRGCSCTLG